MKEALEYLRSLDKIIIPGNYTYLNHCTCYCPSDVRKMIKNKFLKYWEDIPTDYFTTFNDMSFVERKDIVCGSVLDYRKDLKDISEFYTYRDYAKPFLIRVVLPKLTNPRTQIELNKVYFGGDGRHPKIPCGTKLYAFASSTFDELSQKVVDVIYFVREEDIVEYAKEVKRISEIRDYQDFNFNELDIQVKNIIHDETIISRSRALTYFDNAFAIGRNSGFDRYRNNGRKSPFEEEYYREYQDYINMLMEDGGLPNIPYEVKSEIVGNYENRYIDGIGKVKS